MRQGKRAPRGRARLAERPVGRRPAPAFRDSAFRELLLGRRAVFRALAAANRPGVPSTFDCVGLLQQNRRGAASVGNVARRVGVCGAPQKQKKRRAPAARNEGVAGRREAGRRLLAMIRQSTGGGRSFGVGLFVCIVVEPRFTIARRRVENQVRVPRQAPFGPGRGARRRKISPRPRPR
eukprot:789201-Lingulodinium_polyedra.AAC.1